MAAGCAATRARGDFGRNVCAGGPAATAPHRNGRRRCRRIRLATGAGSAGACNGVRLACRRREGTRVFMLKAAPGTRIPHHEHAGIEWTCVLQGAFRHQHGRYGAGDFDEADEAVEHRPVVEDGAECMCLVGVAGPDPVQELDRATGPAVRADLTSGHVAVHERRVSQPSSPARRWIRARRADASARRNASRQPLCRGVAELERCVRTTDIPYADGARQQARCLSATARCRRAGHRIFLWRKLARAATKDWYRLFAAALDGARLRRRRAGLSALSRKSDFPSFLDDGATALRWTHDNIAHIRRRPASGCSSWAIRPALTSPPCSRSIRNGSRRRARCSTRHRRPHRHVRPLRFSAAARPDPDPSSSAAPIGRSRSRSRLPKGASRRRCW